MGFLLCFFIAETRCGQTDQPTDQPTDIATYRAAIAAKKRQ